MAHIHAALMAQYAQDALTTDKPWELWEFQSSSNGSWNTVTTHPAWSIHGKYRRKPERQWYRIALLKNRVQHSWSHLCYTEQQIQTLKTHCDFVRWLTDRIYYDVE